MPSVRETASIWPSGDHAGSASPEVPGTLRSALPSGRIVERPSGSRPSGQPKQEKTMRPSGRGCDQTWPVPVADDVSRRAAEREAAATEAASMPRSMLSSARDRPTSHNLAAIRSPPSVPSAPRGRAPRSAGSSRVRDRQRSNFRARWWILRPRALDHRVRDPHIRLRLARCGV